MRSLFSMMVDLTGRSCLVVGGGKGAERKIRALLEAKAAVTVISPQVDEAIEQWHKEGRVRWIARPYVYGDGKGAFLIFAVTDNRDVNEQVYREASARGQLVAVSDNAELSTFMMSSVFRRGPLIISVSTSGASPALAGAISRELAQHYGPVYEECLQFLRDFRMKAGELVKDAKQRQRLLREVAGEELLCALKNGDFAAYRRSWLEKLERLGRPERSGRPKRLERHSDGGNVHAHDHRGNETERFGSDADESDD